MHGVLVFLCENHASAKMSRGWCQDESRMVPRSVKDGAKMSQG